MIFLTLDWGRADRPPLRVRRSEKRKVAHVLTTRLARGSRTTRICVKPPKITSRSWFKSMARPSPPSSEDSPEGSFPLMANPTTHLAYFTN